MGAAGVKVRQSVCPFISVRAWVRGVLTPALRASVWYNATTTIGLGGILATPDASWGARAVPISQIAPLALPELAVLIALADLGRLDPDRTAIYLALLDEMVASADVAGLAAVAAARERIK